jgi:hypothetical protein
MPDESWPSTGTYFGVAELVFGIAVRVRKGLARSRARWRVGICPLAALAGRIAGLLNWRGE